MSTAAPAESPAPAADRGAFLRARLASILAVAPLGVWTVIHLWNNLAAFQGEKAWEDSVTGHAGPIGLAVTTFIVLAPLAIHTLWGIKRLRTSRPNNTRYGFFANLKYLLQRVSAVGVLAFLGAHLWLAFLHPRLVEHHAEPFSDIAGEMRHNPPTLLVYVLGTLGVSYHLANGLSGIAMGWGLTSTKAGLRKMDRVSMVLFVIFLAMSWGAVYALWSGGAAFSAAD